LKKNWSVLRTIVLGIFEATAFTTMIGAVFLQTATSTFLIFAGLFIGVVGLAIYDLWKA
jgi:hypothetical protein